MMALVDTGSDFNLITLTSFLDLGAPNFERIASKVRKCVILCNEWNICGTSAARSRRSYTKLHFLTCYIQDFFLILIFFKRY
jgi:hypothetical protein